MADNDNKPECKYGVDCYQRNQLHRDRFSHPPKDRTAAVEEYVRRSSIEDPPAKRRKSTPQPESDSDKNDDNESASNGSSSNRSSSNEATSTKAVTNSASTNEKASIIEPSTRCSEFFNANFDKGPHAQRAEYQKLLDSPAEFISTKFLVEMPADFFAFWSFCEAQSKNDSKPENLFSKFGLSLVGPFDVLAKKFHNIDSFEPGDYLRHWRFYYDPPEFQVNTSLESKIMILAGF